MNPKLLMVVAIAVAAGSQMVLKYGLNQLGDAALRGGAVSMLKAMFVNPVVWTGLFFYGISSILWMLALSKVELSLAYPMLAGSYVLVAILSFFLFQEQVSTMKLLGLAIIAIGVIVLSRG